jgi:hypothetical protein
MKTAWTVLTMGLILAVGLPFTAVAGPTPGGADLDGDTVEDAFDNCLDVANADQTDSDSNGCGDACTAPITCDVNGDTTVGSPDFLILGMNFGATSENFAAGNCVGSVPGPVGTPDFLTMGAEFGNRVGPSGITNAQCLPPPGPGQVQPPSQVHCQCTPAP